MKFIYLLSILGLCLVAASPAYAQNCAAVVMQNAYNTTQGTHYFYGWAYAQPTADAAISEARRQAAMKRGQEALAPSYGPSDQVVGSKCGLTHGALAVQPKGDGQSPDTYWFVHGLIFDDSEDRAKAQAVQVCVGGNTQTKIDCELIASW